MVKVEENNNNDYSETALSNSVAIQQKDDSCAKLSEVIYEALLKKISRGRINNFNNYNQLSRFAMKFM